MALPADATVELDRLAYGHPVIYVRSNGVRVDITWSGSAYNPEFSATPPTFGRTPVHQISRATGNETVHYIRDGINTVVGYVRGATCEGKLLREAEVERAFQLCASMRVPRPGALVKRPTSLLRHLPYLAYEKDSTPILGKTPPTAFAGHIAVQAFPGPCNETDIREINTSGEVEFATVQLPHGATFVRSCFQGTGAARVLTWASAWSTRRGHCVRVDIHESMDPITPAQLDYIARLSDLVLADG
ncbi:MAG: hypothetical protein IPL79_05900 [Myxococcales bacterium]|nr:hypothetical protein [Myxococcales bacterium]